MYDQHRRRHNKISYGIGTHIVLCASFISDDLHYSRYARLAQFFVNPKWKVSSRSAVARRSGRNVFVKTKQNDVKHDEIKTKAPQNNQLKKFQQILYSDLLVIVRRLLEFYGELKKKTIITLKCLVPINTYIHDQKNSTIETKS